ncbi:MAG TPA: hypothetical protein VE819_00075 [Steroidobacteraceae bacterium]|jgi:hypothetical protein|nr:hypothetical protein [Steroidobacteraceae bacterium]
MQRRELLKCSAALALLAQPLCRVVRARALPTEVAGVRLPSSMLAQRAAAFTREHCPDYLFNHCMRTYLFGALLLRREPRSYRMDEAFVAAAFHDLGLLPAFESARSPFEIDGADTAERWVRAQGGSAREADRVWFAVELHDTYRALPLHQGPEALLVYLGAGADVDGPAAGELEPQQITEVLTAFPRLDFKRRFTELLVRHCERKPDSQDGTWLEGLCRAHGAHPPPVDAIEREIASAPFAD